MEQYAPLFDLLTAAVLWTSLRDASLIVEFAGRFLTDAAPGVFAFNGARQSDGALPEGPEVVKARVKMTQLRVW